MEKKIEDLTTPEIMAALSDFDEKYVSNPESLLDEALFPTEDLIDLLTLIHYLERSGAMENARAQFGSTYKELENEISRRLGDVPLTT
jgi:hypothetical protein